MTIAKRRLKPLSDEKQRSPGAVLRGERVRALRVQKNLTQEALAAEIGVGRSTLAGIETGSAMAGREAIEALATFFEVSVDYLVGNSSDEGLNGDFEPPGQRDHSQQEREAILVRHWRRLDEHWQNIALELVSNLPKPGGSSS
jgi:transcriptional regulator with XRE-family HTH domain